jgi:hypothetical protein
VDADAAAAVGAEADVRQHAILASRVGAEGAVRDAAARRLHVRHPRAGDGAAAGVLRHVEDQLRGRAAAAAALQGTSERRAYKRAEEARW